MKKFIVGAATFFITIVLINMALNLINASSDAEVAVGIGMLLLIAYSLSCVINWFLPKINKGGSKDENN